METIFPWFKKSWEQVVLYKKNNLLPSGILLSGPMGIGKLPFAKEFSKLILCQENNDLPCLKCRSCILFKAGNHPDFFSIHPEEKSNTIKIEQIRELTDSLAQTSVMRGIQLALIFLAEEMNKAASNALLKTLEEPRGNVLLLLLSNQPTAIPATILSRCQHIKLPLPTKEQAQQWLSGQLASNELAASFLSIADNLPVRALEFAHEGKQQLRDKVLTYLQQIKSGAMDPTQAAADSLAAPLDWLQFLMTLTMDMIRIKYSTKDFLNHHDKITSSKELCSNLSNAKLFIFLDDILGATKVIKNRNNVNLQLLMEKIFINWRYNNDIS